LALRRTSFPITDPPTLEIPARQRNRSFGFPARPFVKEYGMDRSQKSESVAALNAVFNEAGVVVVTRNLGLSVAQSTALRTKMRDVGASYKVAKNRLARLAMKDTAYAGLDEHFTGPTALAYSTDPIAAAKAVVEFAKTNDKLEILGGGMGATQLNADGVRALAAMPSLNELRAKIVGLVNAPATKVVQLVNAPAAKLARVFGAYAAKDAA
jgi:large subunit ribosomal protein L10